MRQAMQRSYNKGESICLQGQRADRLFVLRSGSVGVYINSDTPTPTELDVEQHGTRVATIEHSNEIIGEGGVFLSRRTASLIALEDTTILEHIPIAAGGLERVMTERPHVAMTLCRSLARRLRDMTGHVRELAQAADILESTYDNLAVEFSILVSRLYAMGDEDPSLRSIAESLNEDPLYLHGDSIQKERQSTSYIIGQAVSNQRSGTMTIQKGDILCEEGQLGRALYLVRSGQLDVLVGSFKLRSIGPEEIVGEIAVILKEMPKRTATVKAVATTSVHCVSTLKFHEIAAEQPVFLIPFARSLAARLDTTNRFLCDRNLQSADHLRSIAGDPLSCEAKFRTLADLLEGYPNVENLANSARNAADRAREMAQALSGQSKPVSQTDNSDSAVW